MPISRELVYLMTKGRSSFHRQNINGFSFSADPFSLLNQNNSGHCGFYSRNAVALQQSKDGSKVNVTEAKSTHRITKKGTKKNRKVLSLKFVSKTIDAKDRISKNCDHVAQRSNRIQQAVNRAQKLNQGTK